MAEKLLHSDWIRKNDFAVVFFISGFFGFLLGILGPCPQDSVEAAQVISGVVSYPQPTVWSLTLNKAWSLSDQVCAILLFFGYSELLLNYLVSGLLGMLGFQGISLIVLALSGNWLLSIAGPFFIVITAVHTFFVAYPIDFVGPNTYGILGLSLSVLTLAVIANRRHKLGAFLLGVLPAVHCVFGLFLWTAVAINFLCDFKSLRSYISVAARYFFFGCFVTAASFSFNAMTSPRLPAISHEAATHYLSIFINTLDAHRHPIDFTSAGMYLNIAGLTMSLLWLLFFGKHLSGEVRFLLRSLVVFGVFGMFFGAVTLVPQQYVPNIIIKMMPQRMLNFNNLCYIVVLMGLYGQYKDDFKIQLGLTILVVIFLLFALGVFPSYFYLMNGGNFGLKLLALGFFPSHFLFIIIFGSSVLLVCLRWMAMVKERSASILTGENRLMNVQRVATFLLLIIFIVFSSIKTYLPIRKNITRKLPDRTNSSILNAVSKRSGLLLIPMIDSYVQPLTWIQLMTRRPILLNSDKMDAMVYMNELFPELDRILKRVYGLELFAGSGEGLPLESLVGRNKLVWENQTTEQWGAIRREFGVVDVLVYRSWSLQLPVKAYDDCYTLYEIPQ